MNERITTILSYDKDPALSLPVDVRKQLDRWLQTARLRPVSANYFFCHHGWNLGPRSLKDSYWSYIIKGQAEYWLDSPENVYSAQPGDLIIFPEGVEHGMTPVNNSEMEMVNVHFWLHLYGVIDLVGLLGLKGVFRDRGGAFFQSTSTSLAKEFACQYPGYQLRLKNGIWSVLIELIRRQIQQEQCEFIYQKHQDSIIRLHPVFEMIDRQLENSDLSVNALASKIAVSDVYLRKLFHKTVGCSPVNFIQQQRINKACYLLKETMKPIKEIAAECGFSELPFFYRVFKQHTGSTPAAYREKLEF